MDQVITRTINEEIFKVSHHFIWYTSHITIHLPVIYLYLYLDVYYFFDTNTPFNRRSLIRKTFIKFGVLELRDLFLTKLNGTTTSPNRT